MRVFLFSYRSRPSEAPRLRILLNLEQLRRRRLQLLQQGQVRWLRRPHRLPGHRGRHLRPVQDLLNRKRPGNGRPTVQVTNRHNWFLKSSVCKYLWEHFKWALFLAHQWLPSVLLSQLFLVQLLHWFLPAPSKPTHQFFHRDWLVLSLMSDNIRDYLARARAEGGSAPL